MGVGLPGTGGVLRFTDAAEFAGAPRGPWWPDDVDDFLEQMWDQIDGYGGDRVLEAHVATGSPDIQIHAIAVLLSEAPWAAEPNTRAWALVIRTDGELTVIEYATEQDTTAALMNHVRTPGSDRRTLRLRRRPAAAAHGAATGEVTG